MASAQWSLSGVKRTCTGHGRTDANDPISDIRPAQRLGLVVCDFPLRPVAKATFWTLFKACSMGGTCNDVSSSPFSAAPPPGRSQHARSKASRCGDELAQARFAVFVLALAQWAGSRGAMCGSITVGAAAISTNSQTRDGTGRRRAGRDFRHWHSSRGAVAQGDGCGADRVRVHPRSGRRRHCRENPRSLNQFEKRNLCSFIVLVMCFRQGA